MQVRQLFLKSLGLESRNDLPVYSTLPATPTTPASQNSLDTDDGVSQSPKSQFCRFQLPTLSRFLADFTLGFADGLTVPFALTAGLSSLGHTETVIYAGMAEICAGSISMGIGGYLSARGEAAPAASKPQDDPAEEEDVEEKAPALRNFSAVDEYLAALQLPQDLLEAVREHIQDRPEIAETLHHKATDDNSDNGSEERACSPIIVGLSVALGYLLGGLLPLFPYFFVSQVGSGLRWSFAVCVLALFVFGFTKHYLLQKDDGEDRRWVMAHQQRCAARWRRIKASAWEGFEMVVLGSLAALAAVLCVHLFEGIVS